MPAASSSQRREVSARSRRRTDAPQADRYSRLLGSDDFQALLRQFAVATGLTVSAYDAFGEYRSPSLCSSPLSQRLLDSGCWRGPDGPCYLAERPAALDAVLGGEPVSALALNSLRIAAVPLRIDETAAGALVTGWVFDTFPEPSAVDQVARLVGLPFTELWLIVRQQPPITPAKLATYAGLLRTLAESFLRERAETEMAETRTADLHALNWACQQLTVAGDTATIGALAAEAALDLTDADVAQFVRFGENGAEAFDVTRERPSPVSERRQLSGSLRVEIDGPDGPLGFLETRLRGAMPTEATRTLLEALAAFAGISIERQDLIADLREQRSHLEAVNQAKDEFMAVLSHELRTPLVPILGWVQMLQKGGVPEGRTTRALGAIEENARRQLRLIEELLDLSRILNGKIVLELARVQPADVLARLLDVGERLAESRDLRFLVELEGGLPAFTVDPSRLDQILGNLVANAVKFTPDGGTITLGARAVGHAHDLEFFVADTGKGLPSDSLVHIFERFRQADSTMARRYGGLGIGLSVVRLLAELHGGRAWAESAGEGLGAVFFVRLPVGHDLEAALPLPEPEARANPTGHPGTILLVDDAEDTLEVMRTFLEDAGFRVAVARSADAAVTEARRIGPDVILSDLAMPDRDGFALLQELRSDPRLAATPVVAVTSYASARDRQVVGDAGFDGYLAKPADQGELLETVTAALARRR